MSVFKKFARDCSGGIASVFAISAVPILIGAGVAIDMVQLNQAQTVMQNAVDSAALGGASAGTEDEAEIENIAKNFLLANGATTVIAEVTDVDVNMDKSAGTLTVVMKGKRPTSLMGFAGIDTVNVQASAEVKLPGDGLEVALVLDNTGSMNASGRLPALKTASKQLIAELMKAEKAGGYVRVGIVPFSDYVNVGVSRRKEPWIDVEDDKTETKYACWDTYPYASKKNCVQLPNMADGITTGGTYESCEWDYGPKKEVCGNVTNTITWNGCVGSRAEPLDESIGTISTPYKGIVNHGCTSEIVTLTKDQDKLEDTIDGFVATGETYAPAGLLWGWHMLNSQKPLAEAKSEAAMTAKGGSKAIMLMTDGQNTLAPYSPYHYGGGPSEGAKGDDKTEALCEKIKADGITIYTVSFMITDPKAKALMVNCASHPSKAFDAENPAQLSKAFGEVAASLLAMRISK